ncbi:MAG: TRAP transporter large permease [Bacillota bacterium]
MSAALLLGGFAFFLILHVPIGIAIGLAVLVFMTLNPDVVPLRFLAQGMFSSVDSFPLMAVPFFILAGSLMEGGGLSRRLIRLASSIVGSTPGGFASVTVLACMFFGAISGSSPATVAAIGSIMIPAMVKQGYDIKFSTALTACAGGLGVIIPPSIPMVIYGVATGASIGKLFMGGFGPGLVAGGALILVALYYSHKFGYKGSDEKFNMRNVITALNEAKWALFVPIIILGGIYGGVFTPTEAAVVAVVYGLLVGLYVYRELQWKDVPQCLINTALMTGTVLIIVGTATTLGRIMTIEQIPNMIVQWLLSISQSKFIILVIINVFLLFVGMVMETLAAILILGPLLLKVVMQLGVDPVHFGLIMVLNLAIGFVTPPVGVNLFVACGITQVDFMSLSRNALPFVTALILALLVVTFIPAITLWLPKLLGI